MIRKLMPPSFALAMFAAAASGQVVHLEQKYVEGQKIATHVETTNQQVLTIGQADVETKAQQFMNLTSVVGPRDADGKRRVTHTFDSLQCNLDLPGGQQVQFDSSNPDKKADDEKFEPVMQVFRVLAKSKWVDVIGPDNKIESVERSGEGFDQIDPNMRELMDPKYIKQTRNQEMARLPDGPVRKGDTWSRTEGAQFGGGQSMQFQTIYTYEGTVTKDGKSLDKITGVTKSVTYAMDPASPSPLKVKSSKLKIESSKATLLFDRAQGRVVEADATLRIVGDMTFDANGQELPGKLDLTIASKTTSP
jgi:hypothetical protein